MEVKYWVLVGVVGVLFWLIKVLFGEWLKQQKEFKKSFDEFKEILGRYDERFKTVFNQQINIKASIKEQERKLSEVEIKQKICGKCEVRNK